MLQLAYKILAYVNINTRTQLSVYAVILQTMLTNRYPHLAPQRSKPSWWEIEMLAELNDAK